MDAIIKVEYVIKNICNERDLEDCQMNLQEMVKMIIKDEGLFGVVEDDYKILSIRRVHGS